MCKLRSEALWGNTPRNSLGLTGHLGVATQSGSHGDESVTDVSGRRNKDQGPPHILVARYSGTKHHERSQMHTSQAPAPHLAIKKGQRGGLWIWSFASRLLPTIRERGTSTSSSPPTSRYVVVSRNGRYLALAFHGIARYLTLAGLSRRNAGSPASANLVVTDMNRIPISPRCSPPTASGGPSG